MFSRFSYLRTVIVTAFMVMSIFAPSLMAQATSTVRGRVIDATTGEPMFGVAVVVREANAFAQTDFDGKYELQLPPGQHRIIFQMMSYREKSQLVTVTPGQTVSVNMTMSVQTAAEVVVQDRALNNTQASMLALQKKSATVSDGVSEESIKRSPDSSANDVVKRITGISVVGGKYVFVRGLGERYSTTVLNGTVLPSPEPDKRVVPLDLFPASLIKNIRVVKSFLPEYTAEFSGGLVMIETKEYPEQLEMSFGVGLESNTQTTGKQFKAISREYGNDYLGLGPNSITGLGSKNWKLPSLVESLPGVLPLVARNGLSQSTVNLGAAMFDSHWTPDTIAAPVARTINFSIGDSVKFSSMKFGYIYGTYYKRKWETTHEQDFRYVAEAAYPGAAFGDDAFYLSRVQQIRDADVYRDTVLWGNNLNFALQITANHQVYSKTFLSTNSEKSFREALNYRDDGSSLPIDYIQETSRYVAREIFSETIGGDHALTPFSEGRPHKLHWHFNYAIATRDEPELRNRSWQHNSGTDSPFTVDGNDGSRFYSEAKDTNRTFHIDYEMPYTQWDELEAKLKFGYENLDREKDFMSRTFFAEHTPSNLNNVNWPIPGEIALNPAAIFAGNLKISEQVNASNTFEAIQKIDAAFIQTDVPLFSKLRFVGGVRQERSYQKAVTRKSDDWRAQAIDYGCLPADMKYFHPTLKDLGVCRANNNGVGEIENVDLLPAANFVYEATPDMNFRLAYTETVTRPDLREISDFAFQPYYGGEIFKGNPGLRRSYIHNYDFRWEWYFTAEEYVGIGFFMKNISDPIESVGTTDTASISRVYTLINSPKAEIRGLEFDFRKDFLKQFRAELNLYMIRSKVQVMDYMERMFIASGQLSTNDPRASTAPTKLERPLTGQSELVYNLGFSYFFTKAKKSNVGLFYNEFGDRILFAGALGAPDIVEKGRGTLDIVLSLEPEENFSIKASVKNLTDPEYLQYQDSDITGIRLPYQRYRKGRDISLSASYKF